MKFSPAALFLASASALTLPVQDNPYGADQYPPGGVEISWGRDGANNGWQGFPKPVSSGPSSSFSEFPSNPYAQPYNPNPYVQPYNPNPYVQPYNPNPYVQPNPYVAPTPYVAPNPYVAPVPQPNPYVSPGPDVPADANAPIIPAGPGDVPTQVTIEKSGYSGNGCPAGSVSTLLSPDKTVVTFGFDSFQAVIGPNTNPSDKQKNCQLHLGLRYPAGYQLSIMTATYHGYVRLDPGVTANFISSYYFSQAAEKTAMTRTSLSGPDYMNGKSYTKQDTIQNESMIWSPCGANGILNINNRIALISPAPSAAGEISNDDATIKFEQKLRIQWRRCTGPAARVVDNETPDTAQTVTDSSVVLN